MEFNPVAPSHSFLSFSSLLPHFLHFLFSFFPLLSSFVLHLILFPFLYFSSLLSLSLFPSNSLSPLLSFFLLYIYLLPLSFSLFSMRDFVTICILTQNQEETDLHLPIYPSIYQPVCLSIYNLDITPGSNMQKYSVFWSCHFTSMFGMCNAFSTF